LGTANPPGDDPNVLVVLARGHTVSVCVHQWATRVSLACILSSSSNLGTDVPVLDTIASILVGTCSIGHNLNGDLPELATSTSTLLGSSPSSHSGITSGIVVVAVGRQTHRPDMLIGAEVNL